MNFFGVALGTMIAFLFIKDISVLFTSSLDSPSPSKNFPFFKNSRIENKDQGRGREDEKEMVLKFHELPLFSLIMILSIHSLTDGIISIFLPLKILYVNQDLYWVSFLNLIKLISQIIATTLFSLARERYILKNLISATLILLFTWGIMLFTHSLWLVFLLFFISGINQGAIYANIIKLIAHKAKEQESAKVFGYFKTTMSGGRMMGALLFGETAMFSLNLGLIFLIFHGIVSFILLLLVPKRYLEFAG
ncbi:MAG: MFS transporter [Promethearchaeota archaeon]